MEDAEIAQQTRKTERHLPWKQIILLAVLGFSSTFSTAVVFPNIGSFVRDRFVLSDTSASLFAVSYLIPHVMFAFIWGAISDRKGRRKPFLIAGYIATGMVHVLLPFAPTYASLLILRFLEGSTSILGFSMVMTIAADHAREGSPGKIMGLMGGAISLGTTLAFPVGGAIGASSMVFLCSMGSVILLTCAFTAWRLLDDTPTAKARSLKDAFTVVADHRALLLPYVFTFIDRFTVGFFAVTFPLFVGHAYGMNAAEAGRILAVFLLPFALLTYVFGRLTDRVGGIRLLIGGSLLYGVLVLFTGHVGEDGLVYLMLGCGILAAAMYAPTLWLVASTAPAERRASAMGGFNAMGSIGFALGPLAGGLMADFAGYTEAFYLAGASEILCVLIAWPLIRRYTQVPTAGRDVTIPPGSPRVERI